MLGYLDGNIGNVIVINILFMEQEFEIIRTILKPSFLKLHMKKLAKSKSNGHSIATPPTYLI